MAATDQTYRSQKILDRVFAATCIAMLLSVIWMFVQDYNREFKSVQRDFRDVEAAVNESSMLDQLPDVKDVDAQVQLVAQTRAALNKARRRVASTQQRLQADHDKADERYRKIKADLDSRQSYYDIAMEERSKFPEGSADYKRHNQHAEHVKAEVDEL
jgi:hypothetical protein